MISCGNIDYDGRLREFVKVFGKLGEIVCFSYGSHALFPGHHVYDSEVGYLQFIKSVKKEAETIEADIVFVDDRRATIPALIVNRKKKAILIQDCRELWELKTAESIVGKIGCIAERFCIRRADVLICANSFRAEHMVNSWGTIRPIVFENIRRLEYEKNGETEAAEKLDPILKDGEVRIVSTYGCSIERTNDILVRNINKINGNVKVFLVGKSEDDDIKTINSIIREEHLEDKVVILGQLNQSELKYLISRSHIGVVNYHQRDLNHKYCASGKIYEFLYEGIPVITTTNPPLKQMCDEFGIGEADDSYFSGINKIISDYDGYKKAVTSFADEHAIEDNNEELLKNIKKELGL